MTSFDRKTYMRTYMRNRRKEAGAKPRANHDACDRALEEMKSERDAALARVAELEAMAKEWGF